MAIDRPPEKLKAREDSLTQEVQKRRYEQWFAKLGSELESERGLQITDVGEAPTQFRPKEHKYELPEPEYEEEKVEFVISRRKVKVEPQINSQIESLQRDVTELQSRVNLHFSEQAKHLQALAHQVTRQEIQQRSLAQQVAEYYEKAAPLSAGSRKRDIHSFINTGIIGFGTILGSAIYVTLAGFWSANVGTPIIVAVAVLFIALALERFNLKTRRNE